LPKAIHYKESIEVLSTNILTSDKKLTQIENDDSVIPSWFNESKYLFLNPDVADSVARKEFNSGYQHFILVGRLEGRFESYVGVPITPSTHILTHIPASAEETSVAATNGFVEKLFYSSNGGVFMIGWVDDRASQLDFIEILASQFKLRITEQNIVRIRRQDVEKAFSVNISHSFGFFAFVYLDEKIEMSHELNVSVSCRNSSNFSVKVNTEKRSEIDLRDTALSYAAQVEVFGNRATEMCILLSNSIRDSFVQHNISITHSIVSGAYVEKFGTRKRNLKASIIVCLYGKSEFLFLQNAMFKDCIGFEDYEIIYVSNSPELGEKLLKDIRLSTLIYDIPQTLVLLPGNAGFGAANNAAVRAAETDRLLIVNPDVFPKDPRWAEKHTHAVNYLPKNQTEIFGVPLYYDDGSLMHGGMYFELDRGLVINDREIATTELIRVEHYGKGAPSWSELYTRSRPVQAVTGAFISANREWFEKLNGFSIDFIFGHYEDADLCLKSLSCGVPVWIHDIRMWHLEGKGSSRRLVHEGGSYVNRGLFSDKWKDYLSKDLIGSNPHNEIFQNA
jgi:GT2 family glycosyltransferase